VSQAVSGTLLAPLFPLPDTVFFPETVLPLHVFEPRYRRLAADCLAGDGRLVVVRLRPGWDKDYEGRPPVHEVGGLGDVVQSERLSDGRYNLLVVGRARVRIEAEEARPDLPYRLARVRPLADVLPPGGGRDLGEPLRTLRGAHVRLLAALGQAHADVVSRVTAAGASPGAVVDRIVSAVVPDVAVRQRLLETLEVDRRVELAASAVADLLAFVSGPSSGDDEDDDED
jgi:Lon protease-like protein